MPTNRLMANAKVDLREVDLKAPAWRNRRVITLDERLANLMMAKELKITADFAENFSPVRVSKLGESEFGIGMMTGKVLPGMFIKAADRAYMLGLPGFKGFEDRLEEAMEIEYVTDEDGEDYQEDESGESDEDD
jgi:hypothetical protein